jgi:hypothetical protein
MASFQKIVLIVAIIILVITLIVIGTSLALSAPPVWPPLVPQCPDYWTMDGSSNNPICNNVKNLGTCNLKIMNFDQPQFKGSNATCSKYLWATNCGLSWDGLTYGVPNPCNSSSTSS